MGNISCPVITDVIKSIYNKVLEKYPEASKRENLTAKDVASMVDAYCADKSLPIDKVTEKDTENVINFIEKSRNKVGKSFKYIPYSIEYTYQGKKQTYNILKEEGTSDYKIFNKEGKEVFSKDSKDRRRIFANLAVQQGRAVVITYKDKSYVVNNKNQIISVTTGDEMKWGEENGNRKAILTAANEKFIHMNNSDAFQQTSVIEAIKHNSRASFTSDGEGFVKVTIPEGTFRITQDNPNSPFKISNNTTNLNDEELIQRVKNSTTINIKNLITATKNKPTGIKSIDEMNSRYSESFFKRANQYNYNNIRNWLVGKLTSYAIGNNTDLDGFSPVMATKIKASKGDMSNISHSIKELSDSEIEKYALPAYVQNASSQKVFDVSKAETVPTYSGVAQEGVNILGPETKINIYAGTNENADLSNFAERPFKLKIKADYKRFIKIGRWTKKEEKTGDVNDEIEFKSVEQAFQYFKTLYSKVDSPLMSVKNLQDNILATTDGVYLRKLGRQVNLDKGLWDLASSNLMRELLKASFEQNPQALQRLLATGNATLTHTQDKGKWGTEFPRLLMEVREELRTQQQQAIQQEQQKLETLKQDLGGGEQAESEIKDAVKVAKKGVSFEEALAGQEAFFSKEEQAQIKQGLNGRNLQVMSVSRLTDPAFFSKEIVSFLENNAKKPLNDPTRVTAIEIWSKHDGLPIKDILDACKKYRVAPMVSFSITGLGGTALEGGVMKYQDMLEKVGELIKNGTLNPATTTVRIDPILPGVTNMDDIRKIVETAKSYGIKKFVTSLVQSYGYTEGTPGDRKVISGINNALATEGKTYDWDKYYGRNSKGKINFKPKQEVINEIGKVLLELDKDPEITIQTCAFGIKGLKVSACLDPLIIERITGVNVLRKDGTYERDTSRPECMCYGCHGDFFKGQKKKCYSSCAYCYAAHSGDNKLNYYNEDGTLKDNDYTRTERVQPLHQVLEQFKKDVDLLAGYYEGGGRALTDDVPNVPKELDDKLDNYFMGGVELSIDDYRELWKLIEFYDDTDGRRMFRPKNVNSSSTAASNPLAANALGFEAIPDSENPIGTGMVASETPKVEAPIERPKSVALETALDVKVTPISHFNSTFSPTQIKARGAMISRIFSDIIDEALWDEKDKLSDIIKSDAGETAKDEAKQRLAEINDPVLGRQKIAQEIGIPEILSRIKSKLNDALDAAVKANNDNLTTAYKNLLEYSSDFYGDGSNVVYDAFFTMFNTQASIDIEEREGIRIVGIEIKDTTVSEDTNDALDDSDDDIGNVVSGNDGWNYKVRYVNPFDTLSRKVKGIMYSIKMPESEKDDLGYVRNYPMGQIYASCLSYLSKHMQNPDAFLSIDKTYTGQDRFGQDITENLYPNGYPTFPVLEQMKKVYPWAQQIIDALTDDYLAPDFNPHTRFPATGGTIASQFYTNFRQAYIAYGKIQLGENKYGITPLNYEMDEVAQYDKMSANYNNNLTLTIHSIYNVDGGINVENAKWLVEKITENLPTAYKYQRASEDGKVLSKEDTKEYNNIVDTLQEVVQSFGIDCTADGLVSYLALGLQGNENLFSHLKEVAERIITISKHGGIKEGFNYLLDVKNSYGKNLVSHIFDGVGLISDNSYKQSFYDSATKKTKYSYSADNYLMKTFRALSSESEEERKAFIENTFGKFEWFRNQSTGEWRNKWLEWFYNGYGDSKMPYRNIDTIENRLDHITESRPYSKWTPDDIWQVQDRSYDPKYTQQKATYYLTPIFSDAPMSMTVKGPKMTMDELLYGYTDKDGLEHQGALVQLVNQELWRIQYIQERAKAIEEGRVNPISNFDTGVGNYFCFIPELNSYTFEDGEGFLQRMVRLKKEGASLKTIQESQIQALEEIINRRMLDYMQDNEEHYVNNPISQEQYYNMTYANAAIIQILTVDLAFYGKGERETVNETISAMTTDFQKRFKEVYAGGKQLNTNSKYGKKTENSILVCDDIITSPNYDNIAAIIDASENLSKKEKEDIKGTFLDINVADAQAIRSMDSFRSIIDMLGNWTGTMEEALQHFKDGIWDRADFDIIYQTIKPFVYAVIERNDGFGGTIPVPQQNKNSEICALMMYDLITNSLNNSPVYKAFSRFMNENIDSNGEQLINVIQYESAGKVGNQKPLNISFSPNKVIDLIENGYNNDSKEYSFYPAMKDGKALPLTTDNAEAHYQEIKKDLNKMLVNKKISQKDYSKIISSIRPTEEEIISMLEQYSLVSNSDGSKSINQETVHTIPFDCYYQQQPTPAHHIDSNVSFGSQARNISVADLPEDFEMTLTGKKGSKQVFKGKDAVIDFYYDLLNENLIEDYFGKDGKSGLKGIFSSKEALRDAVTEIVRGNSKYDRSFSEALQLTKDGNFVLDPNSPTVFNMMQEIITSFFKNRITKQTINGAALIQAAGIGLDDNLRPVFDENNKLVGAECYMPITSKDLFEPLLKTKIVNGKEVKIFDESVLKKAGLDKAIGYRIPTENKCSMLPLIIKGFTPLQNGSAIVLPAEITDIAGSDFDVDKLYVMLSSFTVINYDMEKARRMYAKENALYKEVMSMFSKSDLANELMEVEPEDFKKWFNKNKEAFKLDKPFVRKVEYDFDNTPKDNSRMARNNMIIQIIYNCLTSKEGAEQVFNPQGFKDFKRAAKINHIVNTPELKKALLLNYNNDTAKALEFLLNSPTKKLEAFIAEFSTPESPIYPQTFAHVHARNMAGTNQIGIYAVQGSMTAKYQRAEIKLKPEYEITLNGKTLSLLDISEGGKRLKNVGQCLGASADNGKDPNLSDAGSTSNTAPIIGYMLRLGFSHLDAVLIINHPSMFLSSYSSKNQYWKDTLGKAPLSISAEVTTEMLIKEALDPNSVSPEDKKAIQSLCYRILCQHEAMEYLTNISRADSINGSLQNNYAKARVQTYNVDLFNAVMTQPDFPFYKIKEAINNNNVNPSASEKTIRAQLKQQKMGLLHGMYSLGIQSFSKLVEPYFFGANKQFDDSIVKPILYNLPINKARSTKEKIVDNIYKSYITYTLSSSSLFGNEDGASMKQKRDYYLKEFPKDYQKALQSSEEVRNLLGNILQVHNFGSRNRIILQDVGSLGKGTKQDIQRRFVRLLTSEDPAVRKLAADLFIYSYFDNGLQFTPDSFSTMFTTEFLMRFTAYTDALNSLKDEISEEDSKNFIHQFLLTYPEAAYNVSDFIPENSVYDNSIIIDLSNRYLYKKMVNKVLSPNPLFEGFNVYPYISYKEDIYVLDEDKFALNPGRPVYYKLENYPTYSRLPLFSKQMSVAELSEEFKEDNITNENNADAGNLVEDPSIDPHSFHSDLTNADEKLVAPEGIEGSQKGKNDTDSYLSEGKDETQKPMCGI